MASSLDCREEKLMPLYFVSLQTPNSNNTVRTGRDAIISAFQNRPFD